MDVLVAWLVDTLAAEVLELLAEDRNWGSVAVVYGFVVVMAVWASQVWDVRIRE